MSQPFKAALSYFKNFNFLSYVLLLLFSIELAYGIWAINRGFDFSDEAFGFLNFRNPGETGKSATFYAVVFNTFFGWIDLSIINVRIVRLLLLLLCGLVLGLGVSAWVRRMFAVEGAHPTNICLFILIGSLLVNATGTQSLTYNLFSTLLLQLITGIFLLLYKNNQPINRKEGFSFFILGALIFALFTVKFSNAVLIALPLFAFIVYDKRSLQTVSFYIGISVAGAILMALIMFKTSFFEWFAEYFKTISSVGDKTGGSIWKRYQVDFQNVRSFIIAHVFYIIIMVAVLVFNQFAKNKNMRLALAGLATSLLGYVTYKNNFYMGGTAYIYTVAFFYILTAFTLFFSEIVLILLSALKKEYLRIEAFLMIVFLTAIPFIGSLGTNNLLSVQIVWYTSFIFAAFYLLLYSHKELILTTLVLLLAINATIQSVSGLVYSPYRIKQNLLVQTQRLSSNLSKEKVRMDADTKNTVELAAQMVYSKTTFSAGDPVFAFRSDFGLVYFVNGSLPGLHWYREEDPAGNCEHFKSSKIPHLEKTLFILPVSYKMDSAFNTCLHDLRIDFPASYTELGEVPYNVDGSARPLKIFAPYSILKK
jgi:hypothetical protein